MSSINKIKTNDITYDVEDTSKQGLLIPGENITIENNVISAQNSYVLPVAGENTLGGVKVGENLSIDGLGKLSSKNFNIILKNVVGNIPAVVQSGDKYYKPSTNKIYTYIANSWDSGVEPSKGINYICLEDNRIYLYNGETLKLPVDPYTLPTASELVLGGVKVGDNLSITNSGVLSAPNSVGQVSTLPTASIDLLGKILQYVGVTDSNYTNGYFYKCVSDEEATPTYSWEQIDIQPGFVPVAPLVDYEVSGLEPFDNTKTYTAGDIVYYGDKIFEYTSSAITIDHDCGIFELYRNYPNATCGAWDDENQRFGIGNYSSTTGAGTYVYKIYSQTFSFSNVQMYNRLAIAVTDQDYTNYLDNEQVVYLDSIECSNLVHESDPANVQARYTFTNPSYPSPCYMYIGFNSTRGLTPSGSMSWGTPSGIVDLNGGMDPTRWTEKTYLEYINMANSEGVEEPVGNVYQTYGVSWVYPTATAHTLMTQVVNYFMKTGRIPNGVYQSTYGYNGRIIQITKRIEDAYVVFVVVFDGIRRDPVQSYGQKYYLAVPTAIQCFISRADYDRGIATDVYGGSSLSSTRLDWSGASVTTSNNLFVDYNNLGLVGKDNTVSWTPAQDYGLVHKKYVDERVIQVSTLPTAGSSNLDKICQYIGTTDSNYTNGYFYQCVSDGAVTPTYSWERIDVQPQPASSDPGVPSYWVSDNGNSFLHFKVDQKPIITSIINYELSHNGNVPNGGFLVSGYPRLYKLTSTVYTNYVEIQFLYRGYVRRYNSDMGNGWYSVYNGLYFTVYADPTEYNNGELTTVYWTSDLVQGEVTEKNWYYWGESAFKAYNNTDLMKQSQVIYNASWEPQSTASNQGQLYIYTGADTSNFKCGHIYRATTKNNNYVVEELKQAADTCEILMYDGTSSSASIATVNKYYTNIKNGIPTVLLLVTDKYPSGSGSGTSATGKMIVPMSLDTTNPWSSTYRACLIGTAVSYDATDVYFAKQVLMFQDDTVTGIYTLQWLNKYYLELNDWFYRSGLSPYYNSQTYSVGDYVYYSNNIYVCNTAISTPEDFDSSKWTQITYLDYLSRVLIGSALGGSY